MFIDTHCHLYPEYKFVTLDPDKNCFRVYKMALQIFG